MTGQVGQAGLDVAVHTGRDRASRQSQPGFPSCRCSDRLPGHGGPQPPDLLAGPGQLRCRRGDARPARHRRARGRRHSLVPVLGMSCAATVAGAKSLVAIAEWAADASAAVMAAAADARTAHRAGGSGAAVNAFRGLGRRTGSDRWPLPDQPQAPPALRQALTVIDHHVDDYIARARLKPAA